MIYLRMHLFLQQPEKMRQITLLRSIIRIFKWGRFFVLNKLSLNSHVVRINNLVRLGEQHDTDLGMPETISINGQSCLSRGSFVFVRIKGKGPSMSLFLILP